MKPEETVESGIGRELVTYCFMTEKYCFGDIILESDLFFPASFYLRIFYGISYVTLCFCVYSSLLNCFFLKDVFSLWYFLCISVNHNVNRYMLSV